MASSDDSARVSLTPEQETAIREILGYLNFSSGTPDVRFQQNRNRVYGRLTEDGGAAQLPALLQSQLACLQAESAAFADSAQARAVVSLVFEHVLPAYRAHHADLLFHRPEADFLQPFF